MEFKLLDEIISYYAALPFFHGYEITGTINQYIKDNQITDMESNEIFESIAFDLQPNGWKENRWTYYWPMLTYKWDDWNIYYSPDISLITNNCIDYREKRMDETASGLMKNRYAGLLLDFREKIYGDKWRRFWDYSEIIIATAIELIKNGWIEDIYGIEKIKRAIDVAIITNKNLSTLISWCIEYETKIAIDDKPWLWWFSYDILYENKKIRETLGDDNIKIIIDGLENRVDRLLITDWNIRSTQKAIIRLMDYYKWNEEKIRYYLEILESEYRKDSHSNSSWLLQQWYLEELKDFYINYGNQFPRSKSKQDSLVQEML